MIFFSRGCVIVYGSQRIQFKTNGVHQAATSCSQTLLEDFLTTANTANQATTSSRV
jgi:hypothetical protein